MSAFLGPIHFWLYRKITVQQEIVEDIIKLSEDKFKSLSLREQLDSTYGVNETGKLDEIIDPSNIHGWLQERVSQTEYKLASGVTLLLKKDSTLLGDMKTIAYSKGKECYAPHGELDIAGAYKELTDCLLDGMPCDRAYSIVEQDEREIVLKRNVCVHEEYWNSVDGEIKIYYILRDEFIKGFLSSTLITYETIDETTHRMKKGESNE